MNNSIHNKYINNIIRSNYINNSIPSTTWTIVFAVTTWTIVFAVTTWTIVFAVTTWTIVGLFAGTALTVVIAVTTWPIEFAAPHSNYTNNSFRSNYMNNSINKCKRNKQHCDGRTKVERQLYQPKIITITKSITQRHQVEYFFREFLISFYILFHLFIERVRPPVAPFHTS